jgi:hypothetical protein
MQSRDTMLRNMISTSTTPIMACGGRRSWTRTYSCRTVTRTRFSFLSFFARNNKASNAIVAS